MHNVPRAYDILPIYNKHNVIDNIILLVFFDKYFSINSQASLKKESLSFKLDLFSHISIYFYIPMYT